MIGVSLVMLLLLLTGVLGFGCVSLCEEVPVVVSPAGSVRGWERQSRDGRLYQGWTKIPYAQPPVGPLRFKPPKPADKWDGVLDAIDQPPPCPQVEENGQEDCLYLNVYRPKDLKGLTPVVVYIYGGAPQVAANADRSIADFLMDEDLVLVIINYRWNGVGYLSLGDDVLPGNFGLKDQVLTLRWIKKNIESFGGDPKSVTLLSGSFGGSKAHILLNSPTTADLVTRAYTMSGSINHIYGILRQNLVVNRSREAVSSLNCNRSTSEEVLHCLQSVQLEDLIASLGQARNMDSLSARNYLPVIEPEDAEDAVLTEDLSLRPSTKPWITSVANGDYLLFYTFMSSVNDSLLDGYRLDLKRYLTFIIRTQVGQQEEDHIVEKGAQSFQNAYFPATASLSEFKRNLTVFYQDAAIHYPALFNMMSHRGPKWMYQFTYKGKRSVLTDPQTNRQYTDDVASHTDELVYFFNMNTTFSNKTRYVRASPEMDEADYAVSKRLLKYLSNFAHTGNPTTPRSSTVWKQYQSTEDILMITAQGDHVANKSVSTYFQKLYELWHRVIGWKPANLII